MQHSLCHSFLIFFKVLIAIVLSYTIDTDIPTMKELNKHVRDTVATRWYDLGTELTISCKELNIIKSDNPQDVRMCCTKMFEHWLKADATANWNKLIKALETLKFNTLTETIKRKILQGS